MKNLSGISICLLRSNYDFTDSRGRLSLQGEIKLPYENLPLLSVFLFYILNSRNYHIGVSVERHLSHSCRQEIAVALGDGIALTVEGHTALALKADK